MNSGASGAARRRRAANAMLRLGLAAAGLLATMTSPCWAHHRGLDHAGPVQSLAIPNLSRGQMAGDTAGGQEGLNERMNGAHDRRRWRHQNDAGSDVINLLVPRLGAALLPSRSAFDSMRLSSDLHSGGGDVTELSFKGKEFVYNHHLAVPFRPLVPDADKGVGPVALDGNLIIHGDNLHALKSLLPTHAGKIDCIFIDPPYNTGNEDWCYNDNVNSPVIKDWLASNPIGIEDGLRHDKWCAMMWPRLRLLHELLAENGSIFVTIDDNEMPRLRSMLDEIFGIDQFICQITVQSNKRGQTYKQIAKTHEYIIVYAKSDSMQLSEIETEGTNLPESDAFGRFSARELRNRNPKFGRHNRPNLFFPIYVVEKSHDGDGNYLVTTEKLGNSIAILPMNSIGGESCWRWGSPRVNSKTSEGTVEFLFARQTRDGGWRVFEKYRKESIKAKTIWAENKHITEQGTVGNCSLPHESGAS